MTCIYNEHEAPWTSNVIYHNHQVTRSQVKNNMVSPGTSYSQDYPCHKW